MARREGWKEDERERRETERQRERANENDANATGNHERITTRKGRKRTEKTTTNMQIRNRNDTYIDVHLEKTTSMNRKDFHGSSRSLADLHAACIEFAEFGEQACTGQWNFTGTFCFAFCFAFCAAFPSAAFSSASRRTFASTATLGAI